MDSRASTAGRLLTLFAFYVLIHWTSGTRPSSGPGALDCAQLLSNSSLNLNSNDLNLAPEGRVVVVRGALACGAKFGQRERVVLNASRVTLQGRPAATDAAIMYWPDWRDAISLQNGAVLKLQSLVLITGEGGFPKRDSESGYSDFSDVVETSEFANFSDFLEICGSGFRKGSIELEDVLVVDGRCGGQGSRGPRWSRKSLRKAAAGLAAVRLIRYCTCPASADGFAIPGGTPPGPSCRALPCSPTAGCSSLGSTNWTAERISQLEIFESAMFYSDGLKSTTTCGGAVLRAEMPVALGAGLAGGGALLAMVTICLWTAFGKRRCKRRKELTKLMDLVGIESPEDESSPGDHEDGSLEGLCLSQVELGFGMLLWELVSGRKAFQDLAQQDIVVAAVAGRRPPVPRHCPSDIRSLIRDCWAADRKERPSFESVVGRLRRLAGTYAPGLAESGPREQAGETKRGVWRPDVNGTDSSFSSDDGRPFVRDVCLAALQSPATGCLRGSLFRLESSSANLWDTPTPCTSESAKDLGARGPAGQSSVNAITDQVEPQPTVGGAAGEATPRGAAETDPPAETVEKDGGSRSKAATTIDVKGGRICDPGTVKRSPQWVAAASADPGQKYGLQNSGKFGKFGKLRKLDRDSDSSESDAASSEGGGQRQCDGQLRAPSAQVPSADLGARPRRPRTASELSAGPKERPQKAAMAIRAAMACEALPGWQGSISAAEGGGRLIAADGGGRLISACRNDYYEVINAFTTSMNGSEEDWPPPPPPVSFDESNTQRVLSRVSEDVEEPRPLSVTPRSPW
eukprot:evm.model.scf_1180.3 EVM.evm.TU.scf_1180.3   scf_1180:29950-36546(+)